MEVQIETGRATTIRSLALSGQNTIRFSMMWFALLFCVLPSGSADAQIRDVSDSKLIRGLRDRHLYLLAESHCRERLTDPKITPTEQAGLFIELVQVQTARANSLTGTDRSAGWQTIETTAADFLEKNRSHPRRILVEVQLALSHLARAKLIRQEIAAEIAPQSDRDAALNQLRISRSIMGRVEREIDKLIPERRGQNPSEHELSADQLLALKKNVRYQLAVCSLHHAELFDVSDKLNRV